MNKDTPHQKKPKIEDYQAAAKDAGTTQGMMITRCCNSAAKDPMFHQELAALSDEIMCKDRA